MNRNEEQYGAHLKLRERAGEVAWFAYEAVKLRLANNTFYTPDFLVMLVNGDMEVHEVKGRKGDGYFAEDDAKIKVKVAAALYPFRFVIVWQQKGGGWDSADVSSPVKEAA